VHGAARLEGGELDSASVVVVAHPRIPGHRVRRVVARGGFGVVFEGERERDGARVAIKLARVEQPDARAHLAREISALTRIGAPHVPRVHGHGETELGAPYLVMEYLDAPTLAERLQDRLEPHPVAEAVALVLAVLGALEGVHARGYLHLDLKPENILVDAAMGATLVDLGLAAPSLDEAGEDAALDATTEGAGTAEYMAPERCEGGLEPDVRADLYAVGVILFELLAGRPPFWGPRAVVKEGHLGRRPPRASSMAEGRALPDALEEVLARCLAKDRRERFGSAAELRAALAAALLEPATASASIAEGASARPATPVPPASPTRAARGERALVGLLFFESALDLAALQSRLTALGGQLGHAASGRVVAVFTGDVADNPALRARGAAEELIRLGVCDRARVDLGPVVVQARRDGTLRCFSPLFSRAERFPGGDDAEGVTIAPAAAAVLHELAATPSSRPRAALDVGDAERVTDPETWTLVGRDAILTSLVESARRAAVDAAPTLVSVISEPGLGKSHLARVLAERLAALDPGAFILSLRAREPALGDADQALAEMLGRVLDLPRSPGPDGGAALLRERLASVASERGVDLAPAVALALGWLAPDATASPMHAALRAQGAAPGALRSALVVAIGEALRRRAAGGPVFVVLDDAHFAGEAALSALEYAALADARAPLWVCALGRPPFERARPAWGQHAARSERHELGPLDPASAAALCRRLLLPASSVPEAAVSGLVARAQATPLLLVELVRGLKRHDIVRKSPKGEAWYLATDELDRLPELPIVEWLARREIDALAPALRSHARLIALLGDLVSPDDLEGVLRRLSLRTRAGDLDFLLDARIGTRRLLAARVVVEDGAGRVGFRHALVREAVARAVPEKQRRRIHRAAAEHHGAGSAGDERRLAQLAHHAGEAGDAELAARSFFELAELCRARHAYTDAERLYSRALEQASGLDRRAAHRGRGLMRYRSGRYHDALADLSIARELAARGGDVAEQIAILLDEATALDWMDGYAASARRVEEAQALLPRARSPLLDARLALGLGRSAFRFSRNEEAATLLERAAAAAAPLGDDGYETHVIALLLLGFLLPAQGRPDEARQALDRIIALAEEHGDRLHLGSALNVRGVLWANLGDKARLVADMDRSLTIARELGQTSLELMGEFNVGEYLLFLDDAAAAEPHVRRAQALDRRISGDPGLANVALLDARLRLHRGEGSAALEIAGRVRARQREAQGRGEPDGLLAPSDDVLCAMIELSQRDAGAEAWDALEARAERCSVAQERLEVIEVRGAAAAGRGRVAEAEGHFRRALALAALAPTAVSARLRRRLVEASAPGGDSTSAGPPESVGAEGGQGASGIASGIPRMDT
jgi:tetratricopeptide (TPR) repeat protein